MIPGSDSMSSAQNDQKPGMGRLSCVIVRKITRETFGVHLNSSNLFLMALNTIQGNQLAVKISKKLSQWRSLRDPHICTRCIKR